MSDNNYENVPLHYDHIRSPLAIHFLRRVRAIKHSVPLRPGYCDEAELAIDNSDIAASARSDVSPVYLLHLTIFADHPGHFSIG